VRLYDKALGLEEIKKHMQRPNLPLDPAELSPVYRSDW
jgi:hypothetical protein